MEIEIRITHTHTIANIGKCKRRDHQDEHNHFPLKFHLDIYLEKTPTFHRSLLYRVHLAMKGFELTTLVVITNESISSCKYNYHTITATNIYHWK